MLKMNKIEFEKSPTKIMSLKELILKLYEVFSNDQINIDYVQELMSSYKSNPLDWKKYAKFDRYR